MKKKNRTQTKASGEFQRTSTDAERRIRQADRLARVLRVLQFIQSRGRWTIKTISQELECSDRTIRRDLDVLEFAGVPYFKEEKTGFLSVRPDYRFPVLNLTDDELLGQSTATALTQAPNLNVNAGAKPTTEKISASNPETEELLTEAAQLTRVLDLKLADHSQHHEIIQTAQWALLNKKQVAGHYRSPYESKPVKLTLYPYRLCLVKAAWYLIAQPIDAEQPITLRIARFKSLRTLDIPSIIPDDFSLETYFGNAWAVYRGDDSYDVELLFNEETAGIVTETTWHHTQKVVRHDDGTVTLTFTVDGLNEIVRWVLGWAGKVKIVKPEELRALVVQQHHQASELNES